MRTVKIGLYARVSSEKQVQEKTIESQVSFILDYAHSKGELIDSDLHFVDDGFSGSSLERPALEKLRDYALSGNVTRVYVLSPDRLSRKSTHQILLIEEMKRLGVDFIFTNRQIGDTPEDQMLLQIQGVVAEYEREKIMERSRRGKIYCARKGKINVLSSAPFGFDYHKATENSDAIYTINSKQAKIVEEAFDLYVNKSHSISSIAKIFTNKCYETKMGRIYWGKSAVWGMLKNPAYKGTAAFRKTVCVQPTHRTKSSMIKSNRLRTDLSSSKYRPKSDWIYISVPKIIEEATYNLAQEFLQRNILLSSRNNKCHDYLLSGLLRCKICNYAVCGRTDSRNKISYYRCNGLNSSQFSHGRVCSGNSSLHAIVIDDIVWESVVKLILEPENAVKEYQRRINLLTDNDDSKSVIGKKTKEKNKLLQEKSRLLDLYQSGIIEKEEIQDRLKNIRAKIDQVDAEIIFLESKEKEKAKMLTVIRNIEDFRSKISLNLSNCEFQEKKHIIRLLVEEVTVDSIKQEIFVKHIIPMSTQKSQLRSGSVRTKSVKEHRR